MGDVWSMRVINTLFFFGSNGAGSSDLNDKASDIPVESGRTHADFRLLIPRFFMKDSIEVLIRLCIIEAPTALGCGAEIFPDLPTPWLNPNVVWSIRSVESLVSRSPMRIVSGVI